MVEADLVWMADQTALLGGGRVATRGAETRRQTKTQRHYTCIHKCKYISQAKKGIFLTDEASG